MDLIPAAGALCPERHPGGARCGKPAGHVEAGDRVHTPRDPHHGHARGCTVAVPPEMLMCAAHWRQTARWRGRLAPLPPRPVR